MRPEDLDVALRPRSSWEAMELGTALLRRHAGATWRPWLLASLPLFALFNAAAWRLELMWLATAAMWWLKPLFDRLALYVLSCGVFGRTPSATEALRAQWGFGRGGIVRHLLWRRFSPARSLLMPVDLLEGTAGARRRARRSAIAGPPYPQAALLTWTCWLFEWALALGVVAAVFLAVPSDLLPDSLRSFWATLRGGTPLWMQLGFNAALWMTASAVGPFYVAAGFGLYLNRRTETEAWDVELAFRRLRERLLALAARSTVALLLAGCLLSPGGVHAQEAVPAQSPEQAMVEAGEQADPDPALAAAGEEDDEGEEDAPPPATLADVFGESLADDAGFREAAGRAYLDPLLSGKRTIVEWKPKSPREENKLDLPDLSGIAAVLALLGEWGLWILAGLLLLAVVSTASRWLPWLRGSARRSRAPTPEARTETVELPEELPEHVAATARRLWRDGRHRAALALLYRASVESMATQAEVELPPGATEAQCLRAARRLPLDAARELFARTVRVWQHAAYAGRLPEQAEFDGLLEASQAHWGWPG